MSVQPDAGDNMVISWQGVAGRLYTVSIGSDLGQAGGNWTNAAGCEQVAGWAGPMSYTNPPSSDIQRLFRVLVEME